MGTAPSNANLDFMQNTMNDVNKILSDQPEVAYAQVFSGVLMQTKRLVSHLWFHG
ncbi:hypothetical protein OK016_09485 [Vibrio chagasii]|nr:hypothetical protein [Vibrio chagasii]